MRGLLVIYTTSVGALHNILAPNRRREKRGSSNRYERNVSPSNCDALTGSQYIDAQYCHLMANVTSELLGPGGHRTAMVIMPQVRSGACPVN